MGKKMDLTNRVFGRLTVVSETKLRANSGAVIWSCVCDCGATKEVVSTGLKNGSTRSCGCLLSEAASAKGRAKKTHGMTGSSTYRSWSGAKDRCNNPRNHKYANYGGRGIRVCQQNNRRDNVIIALNGESLTMAEYCRKHQLNSDKVQQRLKRGYSVALAVRP